MTITVKVFINHITGVSIWLVVNPLSCFVDHDVLFAFQRKLGNGVDKKTHAVAFHPEDFFEGIVGHNFIIDGSIVPGSAIESSAKVINLSEKLSFTQVFRVLKQQMFKEMCEAGFAGFFAT